MCLDEPKKVVHKPGQLVCNIPKPLSVVDPVESDTESSSDSEHVDLNRVRENVVAGN